jgi:pimeloyl-ACP methyl ester carboxylesterase
MRGRDANRRGRKAPPAKSVGLRPAAAAWCLTVLLATLSAAAPAEARDRTIPTRPGITVDVRVEVPLGAPALILLFEGGGGILAPGSMGFAHRAHRHFLRNGIGSALVGAPIDASGLNGGMSPWFRESPSHFSDIDSVIDALRRTYDLPIWILGVSNGSRSAAAYAMRHGKRIDGVVLVSSSTRPPSGDPIHAQPEITDVSVPLLAIAHKDDACMGSPPGDAARIAQAAVASPQAAALLFSGGLNSGPEPCGNETHHTLFGIEDQVVAAIAGFIVANPPGDGRQTLHQPK